jgi:hypothetical protein
MATTYPRTLRILKWAALVVATVVSVEVVGLAGLLIFGTKPMPAQMLSVSDPMRRVSTGARRFHWLAPIPIACK